MKHILSLCFVSLMLLIAQAQTTTIILLRHAEKDTSQQFNMAKADPPLTEAGQARAKQLLLVLKAYQPNVFYTTNFIRTKATIQPLAQKFNKDVKLYDPSKLKEFTTEIQALKGKTIVVAGHSNTTPALVNLLLKQDKYQSLPDNVYNKFWIVTITDGVANEKVVEY